MSEFDGSNRRKSVRTRLRAEVRVEHPDNGEMQLQTRDISDTGAYIIAEGERMPAIGDIVKVQVQGLPGADAPLVKMRVVRLDARGFGLIFVNE